jgi:hypothetical protein
MLNYVHQVRLYPEVLLVCLSHALSTANEEIMGLLLGAVDTSVCDCTCSTPLCTPTASVNISNPISFSMQRRTREI